MTLSEELQWRGFVNQSTLKDLSVLDKHKRAFYIGFDASADSQTIGNLAALMFAKTFIRHGYDAYLLAGGSTSLIGDPGGKNEERPLQDEKTIAANVEKAGEQIKRIMKGQDFKLVNNLDWTKNLKVLDFLRDIGKHFSMTPLIQRDYIASRLGADGAGISYAEFSYTILQGYDYLHLFDRYKVTLQLGGSDQWGNCLSGVELIRKARNAEVDALTLNLIINKATGQKFGKSEGGAIWLDETKTSVYQFYQFWLNADDNGVGEYLKIYTELDKPKLALIMAEFETNKSQRIAQKTLAYEVTKLVHGKDKADSVKRVTDALFGSQEYSKLSQNDIILLKNELPHSAAKLGKTSLIDVLVNSGLAQSNSEARRYLEAKAVYINGRQIVDNKQTLEVEDELHGHAIVRRGKNSFAIVQLN